MGTKNEKKEKEKPTSLLIRNWFADTHSLTHPRFCRRYLILDVLGQGTFGQVVKCQNMKTHEIVAVKVVKNKPAYFQQSMMEVTILELVRSLIPPFLFPSQTL